MNGPRSAFPALLFSQRFALSFSFCRILKQRSVQLVCAGLQIDVDHAAGAAAVLGVVAVGEDAHFADRFHGGTDDVGGLVEEVDDVDVVVDAVQQEVVLTVRTDAVGREPAANRIARPGSAVSTPGDRRARNANVRCPPSGISETALEFMSAPRVVLSV